MTKLLLTALVLVIGLSTSCVRRPYLPAGINEYAYAHRLLNRKDLPDLVYKEHPGYDPEAFTTVDVISQRSADVPKPLQLPRDRTYRLCYQSGRDGAVVISALVDTAGGVKKAHVEWCLNPNGKEDTEIETAALKSALGSRFYPPRKETWVTLLYVSRYSEDCPPAISEIR